MSAIETLGQSESRIKMSDDCAPAKPVTVTLQGGLAPKKLDDCQCPDSVEVIPVLTGVTALPSVEASVMAQPAAPAIKINVVVPQA